VAVLFNQRVLHDRIEFLPGVPLGFEDTRAEIYFTRCGWAEVTEVDPVRIYSADEVCIDTTTRIAGTGELVIEGAE
jgi:hypothetical protein